MACRNTELAYNNVGEHILNLWFVIIAITALSEEMSLHWARNKWIEQLALEIMK